MKAPQVLIVEDIASNQVILSKYLQKWGFETDVASNGLIAIEKAATQKYDLILMDIYMPEMSGIETAKYIRQMKGLYFQKVPILAISAESDHATMEQIFNVGMDDFIPKPFNQKETYQKIMAFLGKEDVYVVEKEISLIQSEREDHEFIHNLVRHTIQELQNFIQHVKNGNLSADSISRQRKNLALTLAEFNIEKITAYIDEIINVVSQNKPIDNETNQLMSAVVEEVKKLCDHLEEYFSNYQEEDNH